MAERVSHFQWGLHTVPRRELLSLDYNTATMLPPALPLLGACLPHSPTMTDEALRHLLNTAGTRCDRWSV